jgi:hypothetical protein
MNLFSVTIWIMALLPVAGHLFCLASLRKAAFGRRRTDGYLGLLLGLVIVGANLSQLLGRNSSGGLGEFRQILVPGTALLLAIVAIWLMRRSADLNVQSVGIPCVVLSLFSIGSIIALGSMTIAG